MSIQTSDHASEAVAERPQVRDDVMLIAEVASVLKITVKQIRRLERRGAFPIPRLPKLDRHPRYSRILVERFAAGETRHAGAAWLDGTRIRQRQFGQVISLTY